MKYAKMSNNTQEKRERHYALSCKEAHGPLFEMGFFLRSLLQTQEGGGLLFEMVKPTGLVFEILRY